MSVLNEKVLQLSKFWQPQGIITAQKALTLLASDKAVALEAEGKSFVQFNWEDWLEYSDLLRDDKNTTYKFVRGMSCWVAVPETVIHNRSRGNKRRKVKCSRRNILTRDGLICQYCGVKLHEREAQLEHIMPRSRGGENSWLNLVCSCERCNSKKADRTPEEAGMTLLRKPFQPDGNTFGVNVKVIKESWKNFIDAAYWNTELKG